MSGTHKSITNKSINTTDPASPIIPGATATRKKPLEIRDLNLFLKPLSDMLINQDCKIKRFP